MSLAASSVAASPIRVRHVPGAPLVALRIVLPGGGRREPVPGQSLVSGRMLGEGTRRRSWSELAAAGEAVGLSSAGYGGLESHGFVADALSQHWERALELAAEQLFESSFPEDRLQWVRRHAAAELEAQADQADVITARAFLEVLYGEHPKGRPLQGSAESLARLTPESTRDFHAAAIAHGGWLFVAGEIDAEAVAAAATRHFGDLAAPGSGRITPPPPPSPEARRRELRTRAHDQAHLFMGQLTVARAHADFVALEVAGVILGSGAGLSGRIPFRIRDREGLAFSASADTVSAAGLDAGRLIAYVGTAPENVARAEAGIRDELRRLLDDGVEQSEVDDARAYLLGREPFRRESARQWADLAAQGALLDLPVEDPQWRREQLEAVDRAAVERALRTHLDPDRLAVVVGLPAL